MGTSTASHAAFEKATVKKITRRVIPLVFIMYIINYIDRANIGYASLHMNTDLGLTSQAFGFAAGLFFIGYFVFEVPSNVMLAKFGARVWIARILFTWGALAMAMGLVQNEYQLYALRFLLGVAEAGFFPGIMIYLSQWFRGKDRATATGLFVASIPVSYIIAAPLSTFIMDHVHWFDFAGWRWMFIIEGAPAVLLGFVCLFYLVEHPKDAKWLTEKERNWIVGELEAEEAAKTDPSQHLSVFKTLANPKVLYLGAIYFVYQVGSLGVGYWLPQIIKGLSGNLQAWQIGLLGMIPYAFATAVMIWWSARSDRLNERKLHSWLPMGIAAIAMFAAALLSSTTLVIISISIALAGLYSFKSPFWAVPSQFLSIATAGTAIAAINSIGNLGGFVGPFVQGMIVDATGSPTIGLLFFAVLLVIATIMMFGMKLAPTKSTEAEGNVEKQKAHEATA
ncbi:major facilitator transporter [Corynebacterium suranareeae]|uniref:Major facilitator transporter n=1 Tax=Corynebacterium suranareeae TaxID=2506452 RepID=A0A169SD20_9CORY|nr:MFS transporter [Corynebacterium suranareeae]BAU97435.1 major facilitator transporter [Corynebacterium suranareeae]